MAGIYIHIPFCRQACSYCDFHFSTSTQNIDLMTDAIAREIIQRKNYLSGEQIDTIYFGGGTPSLIGNRRIKLLLDTVYSNYPVSGNAEITLEANPDDLDEIKSKEFLETGINRLSIGIQSFSDDDLRFMNRAHDARQALGVVGIAKEAGFENISIDLIYGIPVSAKDQWAKNIAIAFSLGIDHLSCYALTVEPKTVLADMIRKGKVHSPDEVKTISEFEALIKVANAHGYEHYEISNFARNQKYSRHNTSYWQRKKYLGVGPSAHSYDGNSRQWNVSNNSEYIRALNNDKVFYEFEKLTEKNKYNEYILTALRTMWGVDLLFVEKEFGSERLKLLQQACQLLKIELMVNIASDKITLTQKGKLFADRIASELFV